MKRSPPALPQFPSFSLVFDSFSFVRRKRKIIAFMYQIIQKKKNKNDADEQGFYHYSTFSTLLVLSSPLVTIFVRSIWILFNSSFPI